MYDHSMCKPSAVPMKKPIFKAVFPIGSAPPVQLPVRDLDQALPFYVDCFGFTVQERQVTPTPAVLLARDEIVIGLVENGGDPEQESCYIEVTDVDAAFAELSAQALDLTPIRLDEHEGGSYRLFFVRAPDGLCYCLGQQQEAVGSFSS